MILYFDKKQSLVEKESLYRGRVGLYWTESWSNRFLVTTIIFWVSPVFVAMVTRLWTTEQGAQGPIIFVTGLWLLGVRLKQSVALRVPARLGVAFAILIPFLLIYVVAAIVNMLTAALLATWAGLIVLLYASHGGRVLRRLWFPLVYMLFLIPPPVMLVDPVVQVLKRAIAIQAVGIISAFGVEVAARGSSLFVDQYELLIAAACSGMNSLFSLAAIGIFYVHVCHDDDDWRHAALLALAIVPVALGTNLIRVILLLAAVHIGGVRVLDTPLHMATGLAMAALALALLALIDLSVAPVARRVRGMRYGW